MFVRVAVRLLVVLPAALLVCPAAAFAQDPLAARTLRAGVVLTEADLRAEGGGAGARIDALVGLETRRAIYAGRPVRAGDLGPPTLVRRNAVVTVLYRDGALDIRADARALESGGVGEAIRVINLASRQMVRATVVGEGMVEVQP